MHVKMTFGSGMKSSTPIEVFRQQIRNGLEKIVEQHGPIDGVDVEYVEDATPHQLVKIARSLGPFGVFGEGVPTPTIELVE